MDEDTSMQRTSSSSSSTTTKKLEDTNDSSLFSQENTLSSSGLDDSVSSEADPVMNTRWVHGKDTPPPATPPRAIQVIAPSRDADTSQTSVRSIDHAQTWPRATHSGSQMSPSPTASFDRVAPSNPVPPISQMQHTYGDARSGSSRHLQGLRMQRGSSMASAMSQDRRAKRSSRTISGADIAQSLESLPSRSERNAPRSASRTSIHNPSESASLLTNNERSKRMSASLSASGRKSSSSSVNALDSRPNRPDQYEQVSVALDTLRAFLRQRERAPISPTSRTQNRGLRHPPPGPLPPRGSVQSSPSSTIQSISPSSSFSIDTPYGEARPSHSRTTSSTSNISAERLATLEDLAVRVRRMRDDSRRHPG